MIKKNQQKKSYDEQPLAKWPQLSQRKKSGLAFRILLSVTLLTAVHANAQFAFTSAMPSTTAYSGGTVIGTTGSYSGTSSDDKTKVFDGDVNTYFDGPSGVSSGVWAGIDMGTAKSVGYIKFRPRNGYTGRMDGGMFQSSTDAAFTNPTTLFTIPSGTITNFQDYVIKNTAAPPQARYYRYLSPTNGYGNIAEVTFYPENPTVDWTSNQNMKGYKLVGKASSTVGITVDSAGQLIADTNIIAKNIYGHSFSYQYDGVIPDYVFDNDYSLMPLGEVEAYVKKHKHLPDVPSDLEYKERGAIDAKEIQLLLLRKVEELTLHLIELDKRTTELATENSRLRNQAQRKK